MRSVRRWVTFAVITLGLLPGSVFAQQPGFGYGFGRPMLPPPPPPVIVQPLPGLPFPVGGFPIRGPWARLRDEVILMQQLAMHARILTDEIHAINVLYSSIRPDHNVINPIVGDAMMLNPYINILVRSSLMATPPRIKWGNIPRPQTIPYMVSWRAADVFVAARDWTFTFSPVVFSALIQRFSVMVPSVYYYIEAMRETYLLENPWSMPNDLLPTALRRIEAEVFIMRQLMDAIYCNAAYRPFFPPFWGSIEATFGPYRLDVMARGPVPIAPIPFYQYDGSLIAPQVQYANRPAGQAVFNYNPQNWQGNPQNFGGQYIDQAPLPAGGVQNVPGLNGQVGMPNVQIPNNVGGGNPSYGFNEQGGVPQNGQPMLTNPQAGQGIPQQGIPQQGIPQQGVPPQGIPQQGAPQQGVPQDGQQFGPQQQDPGAQAGQLPQQQDPNAVGGAVAGPTENDLQRSGGKGVNWGPFDYASPNVPQQNVGGQQQGVPQQQVPQQGYANPQQQGYPQQQQPNYGGQQQGYPQQQQPNYGGQQQGYPQPQQGYYGPAYNGQQQGFNNPQSGYGNQQQMRYGR